MYTDFLQKDSGLPKLIVIYGPTASGKTARSIEIAKDLDTEIISADSRQLYRMMDIGTAKVTAEEMQGVQHHMIDLIDPDVPFSVGEWLEHVEDIIARLHTSGKIPIICGGTGLYIDALIHDFEMPEVGFDQKLRNELISMQKEQGNQKLWERLESIDPDYAHTLHPNNHRYVLRGIEVKELTGKSKQEFTTKQKRFDVHMECPGVESRELLYDRINLRVQQMFAQGLEQEVVSILETYDLLHDIKNMTDEEICVRVPGLNSIGYREWFAYLRGESSRDLCLEKIQTNTRHYAKRQLTWFRKYGSESGLFEKQ